MQALYCHTVLTWVKVFRNLENTHLKGRDENISKMDVDSVDGRRQHRPSTSCKSAVSSTSTEKSAVVDVDGIFQDQLYGKQDIY